MIRRGVGSGALRRSAEELVRSPAVVIGGFTLLAFPILEILLFRERATQYAHDVFDGDLPGLVALRDDWLRFGPSLWDPHLGSGNASLAQFALPPTTPDFLLSFAIPMFWAYTITYVALIWVAGYGMVRFLRESIGLGAGASLLGGLLYAASFWHFIHYFAIPLLPLSLWLLDRWADAAGDRRVFTLALILLGAFGLYAGLLQLQVLVALVQGAYLLATRWDARDRVRMSVRFVTIWVASVLLYAPVLITQLVSLTTSHRVVWDLDYLYDAAPLDALRATLSLFATTLYGIPLGGLASGSAEYSGTFFLGGIGLLLLVLGILVGRRSRRTHFLISLLGAIPVLYYLALVATPIQGRIPVLSSFQFIRVSHLMPFALTAVAAVGAENVLSAAWGSSQIGRAVRFALGAAVALLAAQAFGAATQAAVAAKPGWILAFVSIAGGTAAGVALLTVARRQPGTLPRLFLMTLLIATAGERLLFTRAERALQPGLGTYAREMQPDRAMQFIAAQPNDGIHRTLAGGAPSNRMVLTGADEAGGYQSIYPLAYHMLFGGLIDPYLRTNPAMYRYFHSWGNRASVFGPGLDPELLDLMGVRWVYALRMPLEGPELKPVFESGQATVYENTTVFPRAFIVHELRSFASADEALAGLTAASGADLRRIGYVLDGDALAPTTAGTGDESQDAVEIVRYTPDAVTIRASTQLGGVLVLTDTYAAGWTVSVDGAPAAIAPVDLAYRGVPVPSGVSTLEFRYRPTFTYVGLLIAAGVVLGIVTWLVVGALSRRPRSGAPPSGARIGRSRGSSRCRR